MLPVLNKKKKLETSLPLKWTILWFLCSLKSFSMAFQTLHLKKKDALLVGIFSFLGRSTVELSMIWWLVVIHSHFRKRCFLPNFIQRNTRKFKQQRTYYKGNLFPLIGGGQLLCMLQFQYAPAYSHFYPFFVSANKFMFLSSFFLVFLLFLVSF